MKLKKMIFLVLLFFTAFLGSAKAQQKDHPYIPLLDTNKVWLESMLYEFGFINVTENYIGTKTDTLIHNDTVYTILYEQNSIITLLREDTLTKKIYRRNFYNPFWDKEEILYDFSMQVGDSILMENHWYWVDSIKNFNIFGIERKVFYIYNIIWIEGIGSLAGILNTNRIPGLIGMGGVELNCTYQNDILQYQSYWAGVYGCNFEDLDQNPPVLNSCYFSPETVEYKQDINLYLNISDQSEIQYVLCGVRAPSNTFYYMLGNLEHIEGDLYVLKIDTIVNPEGNLKVNWNEVGQWKLVDLNITDAQYYESYYTFTNKYFYVSHILNNDEITNNEIKIYPNPITDESQIFISNYNNEDEVIIIYDIFGNILYNQKTTENIQLNSLNLNSGVYFITLISNSKKQTYKIIKL